jgi:hypothetical protein
MEKERVALEVRLGLLEQRHEAQAIQRSGGGRLSAATGEQFDNP